MFLNTQTDFANAVPAQIAHLMDARRPSTGGLVSGTLVETADGWCKVDDLMVGESVYTFDGGLRAILDLTKVSLGSTKCLHIPRGALGNCEEMWLTSEQEVLIDDTLASQCFGAPLVMVPAGGLAGYNGIAWRQSLKHAERVALRFAEEEVVYANSGVLLGCAGSNHEAERFFRRLTLDEAAAMVELMIHGSPFEVAA